MMTRLTLLTPISLSVLFTLFAGAIVANSPQEPLSRLNQLDAQTQQRQAQLQQAQQAQLQSQADVRLESASQHFTLPLNEMPCYPIHHIEVVDYSADNKPSRFQGEFEQAVKALRLTLPHCFGGEGLGILMKQMQNNIIEKGYITTRVIVEEQDLRAGKLTLTVIPGKIGNTIVADSSPVPRFSRVQGLLGLTFNQGDMLNVRDIEQSLENLKRVPTVETNIEILPSENAENIGWSDLKISYHQAFPIRLYLGLDDSGSVSTGKYQGSATLSIDNLFSANDLFYGAFTHSIKSSDDDKGKRANKNWVLSYSIPIGYWALSLSQSYSRYHQEIFGAFENSYLYAGESNNSKLDLSYLIYRDSSRKTTVSGGLWSRQSQNYIDGTEISVQKRRMAGWEAGISHKEYLGNSTLSLSLHYKRGTGARGALAAPEELFGEGTSRPRIFSAAIAFNHPFAVGQQPWQWHSSWSAQWNKTPLIAQDRFSLGGRYTVRGFDGELTLSGDRGWLWRNELAWNVNGKGHQLYFAVDGGRVSAIPRYQSGHHLMGAALGLRGGLGNLHYDVFLGRPMRKPEGFQTSDAVAGFNLGYSF